MKSVSIIIPTWNGLTHLKVCLLSLEKQSFKDFEILIVDNGSIDGSQDFIKDKYPKAKLIELNKNYGFAKAVNNGIKKSAGDYIVLLNNDTKLDRRFLEFLVAAANRHSEVGFVTGKMLQFFKPHLIDGVGDYIDVVGHANGVGHNQKDSKKFDKSGYVFLVNGGGSLFKKEVFKVVGLLDEDFFAYFEDVDLCFRAQLLGFKGWYESKAKVYHVHKATSSKNPSRLEYLQFRNMTQTIIKNFPRALLFKDFNWLKIMLVNLNTLRFLILKGYILSAIKSELFILKNLTVLLKKRSAIQRSKTVSDEYIITNVRPKELKFRVRRLFF